jgi:hypothetical protein
MYGENIKTMIIFCRKEQETKEALIELIEKIEKTFILKSDVFLYEKSDRYNTKFITFKVLAVEGEEEREKAYELYAKFINRKAKTNTFFTINALNRLMLSEIGEIDPTYKINWLQYRDKILMLKSAKESDRKYLIMDTIKRYSKIYKDNNIWLFEDYKN